MFQIKIVLVNRVSCFFLCTYFLFTPITFKMLLKLKNLFFNFLSKNDKNSCFFQENPLGFFHHFIWVFSFLIYPNSLFYYFLSGAIFSIFHSYFCHFSFTLAVPSFLYFVLYFIVYFIRYLILYFIRYFVFVLLYREC